MSMNPLCKLSFPPIPPKHLAPTSLEHCVLSNICMLNAMRGSNQWLGFQTILNTSHLNKEMAGKARLHWKQEATALIH